MTQQIIGVGSTANDTTGDPIRTSFQKTDANFTELYNPRNLTITNVLHPTDTVAVDQGAGIIGVQLKSIVPGGGTGGQILVKNSSADYDLGWGLGTAGPTGFSGSIGPTGFVGSVGFSGSIGPAGGYSGSQGNIGPTGFSGSVGFVGSLGTIGLTGYTGSLGTIGFTGSIGAGFTGSASTAVGPTGVAGSIGFSGSTGIGYALTASSSLTIPGGLPATIGFLSTSLTAASSSYLAGDRVRAVAIGNAANYMEGTILSFTGTTLTLVVDTTGGSGTYSSWGFAYTGNKGYSGSVGAASTVPGPTGFTGSIGSGFTGSVGSIGFTGSAVGTPASTTGGTGALQYNNAGAFASDTGLVWTSGTQILTLGTSSTGPTLQVAGGTTAGKPFILNGSNATGNNVGGSITISAGGNNSGSVGVAAGALTLNGGAAAGVGTGGALTLSSGAGYAAGHVYIIGAAGGAGGPGQIYLQTGSVATTRITIDGTGSVQISAPTSGTALIVNGVSGSSSLVVGGGTGVAINAPASGTALTISGLAGSNSLAVSGGTGVAINAPATGNALVVTGVSGTHSTKISDSAGNSYNAGLLESPINTQNANYTCVLSDSSKTIYHSDSSAYTWTIPANATVAYPIGTVLVFDNDATAAVNITIAIGGTDILTLVGTGTTGSRTLSQFGKAYAQKVTATRWKISGVNLT